MWLFATILILCILGGVETDLFIPSFPELREVFHLSPFMVQLTLSVNFIAYCICSLFAGTLGDRYNTKHLIIISLIVFVIGSLLCVLAVNFYMLIVGRFLQGIGIAAPTTLAYVIVSDKYPIQKQPAMLGILSGITTISMAFAPTVGSYINLFFNWRGNFTVLLILAIIGLVASIIFLPNRPGNREVSLSPMMYVPLLKSKKILTYSAIIGFLATAYFVFIGMSSLLYIGNLGVPLEHFGYYQGAIAGIFAVVSFASPKLFDLFGQKRCLHAGMVLSAIAGLLVLFLAIFRVSNPLVITLSMMFLAIGAIFPINILYPHSLHVIEGAKGRVSALIMAIRLILVSVALSIVGAAYDNTFFPIGLTVSLFTLLSVLFLYKLLVKKWILLDN